MSEKMSCPACGTHTSTVLRNFQMELACPECGLPHDAAVAVLAARSTAADRELLAKYEEAVTRAARAERKLAQYRELFEEMQGTFEDVSRQLRDDT